MMHETLKKLTDEDLAKVHGGQILKVEGTDTFEGLTYRVEGTCKISCLYFVPNAIGFFIYATEEEALRYAPDFVNPEIINCLNTEEAAAKAAARAHELSDVCSLIRDFLSGFPF